MNTTSLSLLERLREPTNQADWDRFVRLYTPMLFEWARRQRLAESDAADLVQDVFLLLLRKLPEFVYDPDRSFRGWLQTVLRNKHRERLRVCQMQPAGSVSDCLAATADVAADFAEDEYRRHLVSRALQLMQQDFEAVTWQACWQYVVLERKPADVAADLNVSVDVVYAAKSRVLRRLRQELAGLWE